MFTRCVTISPSFVRLLRLCLSDRPVTQRDEEIFEKHVQAANYSGHVAQQVEEVDSAEDEGTADPSDRRIAQPAVAVAGQLQQSPVHDSARPVEQSHHGHLGAARPHQVHPLAGSFSQQAR